MRLPGQVAFLAKCHQMARHAVRLANAKLSHDLADSNAVAVLLAKRRDVVQHASLTPGQHGAVDKVNGHYFSGEMRNAEASCSTSLGARWLFFQAAYCSSVMLRAASPRQYFRFVLSTGTEPGLFAASR